MADEPKVAYSLYKLRTEEGQSVLSAIALFDAVGAW